MRAPPLVRTQLGESIKAIASKDFPEHWPGLLPSVLQNLSSQVPQLDPHIAVFAVYTELWMLVTWAHQS